MAAGGAAAFLPVGYGDVGSDWLSLEHISLRLPRWDANGFRAAVISDVHANDERQLDRAILAAQMAIEAKPDVILLPGDFVNFSDNHRVDILKRYLKVFGDATCPVFATMGNHDYWTPHPGRLLRAFVGSPVRLLRNEVAEVRGVSIAGLDDAVVGLHRPEILVPGRESHSLLTMLHEPDYVQDVPDHVSLQVSGHSHGGQICLPMGIPLHTPGGAKRYIDGFYPGAKVPLFVTRGVGTSGPPFRLFCRPQIALLTLRG